MTDTEKLIEEIHAKIFNKKPVNEDLINAAKKVVFVRYSGSWNMLNEAISELKAVLDDFGERGMCTQYTPMGVDSHFFHVTPTHTTSLRTSIWWQMFQEFCAREGKEIM
jgi:hypothetical protein